MEHDHGAGARPASPSVGEMEWTIRPQRIVLSIATVALLLVDGTALVEGDLARAVGALAVVNLGWNLAVLGGRGGRWVLPRSGDLQIAVDLVLALTAVTTVDAEVSPLAWMLLVVPVVDVAARYGSRAGLVAWTGVSLLYMAVMLRLSTAESTSRHLLNVGIQQSVAVLGVTVSVSAITARVRRRLEATESARSRAEEKRQQLWIVSRAARTMGTVETIGDVPVRAVEAARSLGLDRADVSELRNGRWRLLTSAGDAAALDPDADPMLARARQYSSPSSVGVSHAKDDELQGLFELGYQQAAAVVATIDEATSIAIRGYRRATVAEALSSWESLETLVAHTAVAMGNARSRADLASWARQLDHRAHHDELTGLANRAQLLGRLTLDDGADLALLFLDLNGFKQVNDSLGHDAGDQVLREVAHRLATVAGRGDLVARLGGDEFVVAVRGRADDELATLAARIIDELGRPIAVGPEWATVGVSIGIAHARSAEGGDVTGLLSRADGAMYEAKEEGRRLGTATWRFADGRRPLGESQPSAAPGSSSAPPGSRPPGP
ncbi:MAG: GGDEF domain-containing protein [Actinomycetota bacterium]